jgi:hypothetical protein
MRDEDKPFICYKQGWSMKIVPRNAAGWRAFGLWMASLIPMIAVFAAAMATDPGETLEIVFVVAFLALTGAWVFAMIRWMLARSEIVDLAELMELKRRKDGSTPSGRRPRP